MAISPSTQPDQPHGGFAEDCCDLERGAATGDRKGRIVTQQYWLSVRVT
jgi:hypothetical protein